MASGLENLISKTRMMAGLSKARELTDRQLLEEFAGGDETAFTVLVDRYGSLVMGVCQRILQHTQDAEDAFQATFMVLARKAGKITWEDSVANWLHSVACRIAFQVRREKARRRAEPRKGPVEPAVNAPDPAWSDLKPVLDEELERLPARYRIPIILCCLEGKSRDEAAAQLGWSVGSLKGRLERAREILRSRLAKRGLTLSAALAATMLIASSAQAAVPLTLGLETVRAGMAMLAGQTAGVVSTQALYLAQGALHTMFIAKLKFAAAVMLTVVSLGLGTGYVAHQTLASDRNAGGLVQQNGQKNDGQQNQKDDGQRNQKDDGRKAKPEQTSYVPELAEFLAQRDAREERKQQPSVNGIVHTIDAAKINLLTGRDNPEGQSFDLAKDVKVVLRQGRDTKNAKLADVQPKTRVTLILDDAKKVVQTIEIIGADAGERGERGGREGAGNVFRGLVTEIDAAKKTISFQAGGRGDDPVTTKTFDLAKDVKVAIRTGRTVKDGKLDAVPLKTVIQCKLDDTKKIVQSIEVIVSTTASGSVSEIDDKSITLTSGGRGDDVKSATYPLAKDVKVYYQLPGQRAVRDTLPETSTLKVTEVPVKSNVTVQLDDELKTVQGINVQLPHVRGAIGDVDAKKGTLTLKGGRGDDLNLTVPKDVRILIDGKAGTLDKIAAGAEVTMFLSPDRTRVLWLQTPPPPEGRRGE